MKMKEVREELMRQHLEKGLDEMLEIVNCGFDADEPVLFGEADETYAAAEHEWYMSRSRNIHDMPLSRVPKIWRDIADEFGDVNSNYGWCLYDEGNCFQYEKCIAEMKRKPDTRRGVMIYNRPSMHDDAVANGRNDFICTMHVQALLRADVLWYLVNMRSSDAVYGYRYDWLWHQHVIANMRKDLKGIEHVAMKWNAGSLHVYPRHRRLVEDAMRKKT